MVNLIKFKGEYLNGKKMSGNGYDRNGHLVFVLKNGKGKEFYMKNKIKFEGEYLNGKRWKGKGFDRHFEIYELNYGNGRVKELNYNFQIIYEGEYLNGLLHGTVKEYYHSGNIKFIGEYLNGKRNGKGTEYFGNGVKLFEGEYLNDFRNGKGLEYQIIREKNVLIYEGEYSMGMKWNGKVKKYNNYIHEYKHYEYIKGNKMELNEQRSYFFILNLNFGVRKNKK